MDCVPDLVVVQVRVPTTDLGSYIYEAQGICKQDTNVSPFQLTDIKSNKYTFSH